ncbi:hypothetical protein GCM10009127_19170 [Alteraurantiacibacter aestuarii]|uniref:iron-containing redox enzyme family protein n=1 Tax=Alteraurantiacibacter aestuarii TaxID=650004 RepID=UPI0031D09710
MLATTEQRPLEREEFRQAMVDAINAMRAEDSRFYRLLKSGRCPKAIIRQYAEATVHSAERFCAFVSQLAQQAPDPVSRLNLIENLLEEEGVSLVTSGLLHRPETAHPALARRFARAVGANENPQVARHAVAEGWKMLENGEWVEAVAHLLVGQELHFADAAPAIAEALEAAGIARHDVAFFWVHKTADREHGEQALDIVLRHATTRDQQERCIAEARRGAEAWMEAHGGRVN